MRNENISRSKRTGQELVARPRPAPRRDASEGSRRFDLFSSTSSSTRSSQLEQTSRRPLTSSLTGLRNVLRTGLDTRLGLRLVELCKIDTRTRARPCFHSKHFIPAEPAVKPVLRHLKVPGLFTNPRHPSLKLDLTAARQPNGEYE